MIIEILLKTTTSRERTWLFPRSTHLTTFVERHSVPVSCVVRFSTEKLCTLLNLSRTTSIRVCQVPRGTENPPRVKFEPLKFKEKKGDRNLPDFRTSLMASVEFSHENHYLRIQTPQNLLLQQTFHHSSERYSYQTLTYNI